MDEDFNTAQGLGAIFELVKEVNKYADTKKVSEEGMKNLAAAETYIRMIMEEVLGVQLKNEENIGNLTSELVEFILELRKMQDTALASLISTCSTSRDAGIKIKDGKDQTQTCPHRFRETSGIGPLRI